MNHVICGMGELRRIAAGTHGETHRVQAPDGMIHLIDADPASILESDVEMSDETEAFLEGAVRDGTRVHVFPASRSICRATEIIKEGPAA